MPSCRATRGTWDLVATARPGGFQGLKHTQRKELELLLAPAPTQQTVVSATPKSPRAGAGTPAHHPSGTGSGDRRCPRPWGDPCGATSAQGSQPSCVPKNLSASITQGNRNLAGRQGMGLSVPASIQPLGEQVSTPKKQVLCLRTRMRHLPGLGPCRIQLHSRQAACGAAQPCSEPSKEQELC